VQPFGGGAANLATGVQALKAANNTGNQQPNRAL